MEFYSVYYFTKSDVFSRSFILRSDANKFYKKVISRKNVIFASLDLMHTEIINPINRLKIFTK